MTSVDFVTDTSLVVDISDALSEQDKVKFTVHTKVSSQRVSVVVEDIIAEEIIAGFVSTLCCVLHC